MKQVFIIHGRDLVARDELARFLANLGLKVRSFEEVADDLGANPFIADIVFKGIGEADAVVALFTPDELTAYYPFNHEWRTLAGPEEHRWQARPNVIFEAGVALGVAQNKTLLTSLGANVELFSDLSGKHILRLDAEAGVRSLHKRLSEMLSGEVKPCKDTAAQAGNFASLARPRWPFHDEVYFLANRLRACRVGPRKARESLLTILTKVIRKYHPSEVHDWNPKRLMQEISDHYRNKDTVDDAFWWLLIYGVIRYDNETDWWDDKDVWDQAVKYTQITERFRPLVDRIFLSSSPGGKKTAGRKPKKTTKAARPRAKNRSLARRRQRK